MKNLDPPPPPHSRIWHCCCEINLTNLTKARAVFAVVAKAYRALILIVMGMESEIPGPGCSNRVKKTESCVKFEFRYESLRSKISIILFVYNLMFENYTGKCFWIKEKETWVKIWPWVSTNGLQTTGRRATWICDLLLSAEINPALQSLKVNYDGKDPWIPDV